MIQDYAEILVYVWNPVKQWLHLFPLRINVWPWNTNPNSIKPPYTGSSEIECSENTAHRVPCHFNKTTLSRDTVCLLSWGHKYLYAINNALANELFEDWNQLWIKIVRLQNLVIRISRARTPSGYYCCNACANYKNVHQQVLLCSVSVSDVIAGKRFAGGVMWRTARSQWFS